MAAVLPYIPASNAFFVVGFTLAERVMYLPCAFFCVWMGSLLNHIYNKCSARNRSVCLLLMLGLSGYSYWTTSARAYDWRSIGDLLRADVLANPSNPKNMYSLGMCFIFMLLNSRLLCYRLLGTFDTIVASPTRCRAQLRYELKLPSQQCFASKILALIGM